MKSKLTFTLLYLLICNFCFSQIKETSHLEISVDGGIPTGDNAKMYSFGIGGNLRYLFYGSGNNGWFDLSDVIPFTVSAGAYSLFGKDTSANGVSNTAKNSFFMPVMVGSKCVMERKYIAFEAGWSYLKQKEGTSAFAFNVEAGLSFKKIDSGVRFLGLLGKNDFFLGFATLQLTYKLTGLKNK